MRVSVNLFLEKIMGGEKLEIKNLAWEPRPLGKVEIDCQRQLRRRSRSGDPANQLSGSERVNMQSKSRGT